MSLESSQTLGQNFCMSWFRKSTTVIFLKVEKKIEFLKLFLYFIRWLLILFVLLKKVICFWGSVCVFLRLTLLKVIVLSRFLENDEIFKDYLTSFTSFREILKKTKKKKSSGKKKKALKMTSWLVIFRAFLFYFFSSPPTLILKKNSRKSSNKKILALQYLSMVLQRLNKHWARIFY